MSLLGLACSTLYQMNGDRWGVFSLLIFNCGHFPLSSYLGLVGGMESALEELKFVSILFGYLNSNTICSGFVCGHVFSKVAPSIAFSVRSTLFWGEGCFEVIHPSFPFLF